MFDKDKSGLSQKEIRTWEGCVIWNYLTEDKTGLSKKKYKYLSEDDKFNSIRNTWQMIKQV